MKNFVAVESLRGWMAWWVVVGHALHLVGGDRYVPPKLYALLTAGDAAVNIFIIISGFVITHLLLSKQEGYGQYITRRAFRLFPVYFVCLLLAGATASLYMGAYDSPWTYASEMRAQRDALQWSNFWPYAIGHIFLLHGLLPDSLLPFSSSAFLAPAWSLSLEWQFYLVAPFLVAVLRLGGGFLISAAGIGMALFVLASSGVIGRWSYPSFLPLALNFFLIGILCRLTLEKRQGATEAALVAVVVAVTSVGKLEIIIWGAFYIIILVENGTLPHPKLGGVISGLLKGFAWNAVIQRMGKWSYSTYLVHIPIFSLFLGGGRLWGGLTSQFDAVILLCLSFPVVIAASWLLFNYIEMPGIQLGRIAWAKLSDAQKRGDVG